MLTALSIRDVVLIEKLDLNLGPGLTVLTGETGAGKSILLDSLGLALGERSDQGLVRTGAAQASVAAEFRVADGHPVCAMLEEQGIPTEDSLVLRRVVGRDGRSRGFVNDQPVGAAFLRRLAGQLIEVGGQHDQMGLADAAGHAALLDAAGVPSALVTDTGGAHRAWRQAAAAVTAAEDAIAAARRDEDWLRHAVAELDTLAPILEEEQALAAERHALQAGERRAEAVAAALSELAPQGRGRSAGPAAALRSAARALQKVTAPDGSAAAVAQAALDHAEEAVAEAETLLSRLASETEADPRRLEAAEQRLFALRAAGRKHGVPVAELPALRDAYHARLDALKTGTAHLDALARAAAAARATFAASCTALSQARRSAAARLDASVGRELPPLRLDRARFTTEVMPLPEDQWGAGGADQVRFLVTTNPGQAPGPLGRIASGGELSRLLLALKVVLAGGSPAGTLVFDEVDSGIGGATAAAVGDRLAAVAGSVQVLLVTHSPQVAARGGAHLRVSKTTRGRVETRVEMLDGRARREEIARMLAGETVTDAARAAADDLLGAA